jgi:regulator of protease activity HflC (stomatin/prohibitin superfamily)
MGRIREYVRRNFPYIIICALISVFILLYLAPSIFIIVRSGEVGVLYRLFSGGTVTDRVYDEGLHVIVPWNRMYVYNVRVQEEKRAIDVLTSKGLMINLQLSVRYRPEREFVGVLHQRVGPDYLDKIVIPEVESVVRTTVGRMTAEEVFTTQGSVLQRIVNEAVEQVVQRFVLIDEVLIRKIELPAFIRTAIETKLEQKELAEAYEFKLERERDEAKRKTIEAWGFAQYNQIVATSLSPEVLQWKGIQVSKELATSENAKIIVIGNGPEGLPIILGSGG